MKKGIIIITGASFLIGLAEALIYYNMGKKQETGKFTYGLPPASELAKTAGVVIITSVATGLLSQALERSFASKSVELAS